MLAEVSISKLNDNKNWIEHIEGRVREAIDLEMVSKGVKIDLDEAVVFLPSRDLTSYLCAGPNNSLDDFTRPDHPRKGWVKRHDLFQEIAEILCSKFTDSHLLFCEASLRKAGDRSLESDLYHERNKNVFLYSRLNDPDGIVNNLRKARSWRIIGILGSAYNSSGDNDVRIKTEYILFDALDGDSLILIKLMDKDEFFP